LRGLSDTSVNDSHPPFPGSDTWPTPKEFFSLINMLYIVILEAVLQVRISLDISVVDPDPKGSDPFCRIWIRIIGSDPDLEPKGYNGKFYVV